MKTTKAHFKLFKDEVLRTIKKWNLEDWRIDVVHEDLKANDRAQAHTRGVAMVGAVVLNTDWQNETVTPEALKQTARHECVHILMGRVDACMHARYVTEDEITGHIEQLVRHLERLLP